MRLKVGLFFFCLVLVSFLGVVSGKEPPTNPPSTAPAARADLSAPPLSRGTVTNALPDGILAFNSVSNETKVIEGEPQAHFNFNFTNLSSQPVTVLAVDTSCACTTVETPPLPWTVGPQATGKIPVVMDVAHETGRDLETVTVTTPQGLKDLTVVAIISPASTNAGKASPQH